MLRISHKLHFTPNTLGYYGLKKGQSNKKDIASDVFVGWQVKWKPIVR